MKTLVKIFVALVLVSACDDGDNNGDQPLLSEETYTGHFQRTTPMGIWMVANVTLEFSDGSFSGESDQARYPAICNGAYALEGNNVTFENKCVWTADFDWTLILNETFEIQREGPQLTLTKNYGEGAYDQYILTRQ